MTCLGGGVWADPLLMSVDTMVGELKSPEFDFRLLGVDRDDDLLLMIMCPRVLDLCICMDRMKSNRIEGRGMGLIQRGVSQSICKRNRVIK